MQIGYLWLWYAVAVVVSFFILWWSSLGNMPPGVAFLCATIIGLVVGLILIPYYKEPNMTQTEENWLTAFVIVTLVLPVVALIWVFAGKEYKQYLHKGMKKEMEGKCFVDVKLNCDSDGNCSPASIDKLCDKHHLHARFE